MKCATFAANRMSEEVFTSCSSSVVVMDSVQNAQEPKTLNEGPTSLNKGTAVDSVVDVSTSTPEDATLALAILDLVKANDTHHPIHWPAWKRWGIVSIYCLLQVFVCLPATSYQSIEFLIKEKWGGSTQVITLGQSLFVLGTAIGPVFLGPLS
jgi:hypothetical protein